MPIELDVKLVMKKLINYFYMVKDRLKNKH